MVKGGAGSPGAQGNPYKKLLFGPLLFCFVSWSPSSRLKTKQQLKWKWRTWDGRWNGPFQATNTSGIGRQWILFTAIHCQALIVRGPLTVRWASDSQKDSSQMAPDSPRTPDSKRAPDSRGGELMVLRVREHPLVAKNTLSKLNKYFIKHFVMLRANKKMMTLVRIRVNPWREQQNYVA